MQNKNSYITIVGKDCPGLLQTISDCINEHDGNWLESSISRNSGLFAGIVSYNVSNEKRERLEHALASLVDQGINVMFHSNIPEEKKGSVELLDLVVEANDRPGIVEEIASALANVNVNIEQIETACESASMAGYQLFAAHLLVALPEGFTSDQLEEVLENVSDDLMVSLVDD